MLRSFRAYGLLFLFFILLATGVFRCVLEDDKVFSGSDMNIGLLTINHQRLPERFFGGYSSVPVMGNAGTTPLTFSNLGKSFLDPVLFSNIWYSLFLIVSSISLIAYLRLFNIRWLAALLGAVSAFWVGSITLSSAGHLYKLGVMAFYSLSLYLLERSMRSENLWKAFGLATSAGLCVGLMLLEQQDVGLFAGLVLGSYVLVRMIQLHGKNWIRWGIILLPVALIGGGLSATTALRAYNQNVVATDLKRDSVQQWNFVTQWSMVPSELPDLIAPGYTGWKTGSPEGPYWGKIGESPEWETMRKGFMNFRLDSLYIGVIPVFLALLGTIVSMGRYKNKEDRVFLLWSALALVTLLLALGKYTFLYKPFYSLPLVGNIRAPIKFLHNFQAIIGILAAFGAHHMLCADKERRDGKVKVFMFAAAGFAVVAAILSLQALSGSFKEEFSQWGNYASLICKNISKAWLHASIMGAVLALVGFLTWKKLAVPKQGLLVLLIGMVVFDSIFLTSKYFEALDMSGLRKGNAVLNYLKEYQGDNRIYFLRSDGPYEKRSRPPRCPAERTPVAHRRRSGRGTRPHRP